MKRREKERIKTIQLIFRSREFIIRTEFKVSYGGCSRERKDKATVGGKISRENRNIEREHSYFRERDDPLFTFEMDD